MGLKVVRMAITTAADGSATVNSDGVNGLLYKLHYVPGTLATGADLTISHQNSVFAETLLTITNAGTSAVSWYPRGSSCGSTGTSNTDYLIMYPIAGNLRVVVAEGGNAGVGNLYAVLID